MSKTTIYINWFKHIAVNREGFLKNIHEYVNNNIETLLPSLFTSLDLYSLMDADLQQQIKDIAIDTLIDNCETNIGFSDYEKITIDT